VGAVSSSKKSQSIADASIDGRGTQPSAQRLVGYNPCHRAILVVLNEYLWGKSGPKAAGEISPTISPTPIMRYAEIT